MTLSASAVGAENVQTVFDPARVLSEAEAAVARAKQDKSKPIERIVLGA